ncbi:octopamine receptor [Mactra antiquata]
MAFNNDCVNQTTIEPITPSTETIVKIVALGMIELAVVLGNSLVVAAVLTTRKLRTVTNIFIVSLACADLLLGFSVLPFSISIEVVDNWLWGDIWCSIWLAIDVWLCTASILSLCAISFDRYVAVTHPIRYPSIMSPYRGRILVAFVWILAFVICLPPLLGWNDGDDNDMSEKLFVDNFSLSNRSNTNPYKSLDNLDSSGKDFILNLTAGVYYYDDILSNLTTFLNHSNNCLAETMTCELTPTRGYRIYAAMGSFFLPMLVMVFFYFRIYLTAIRTAASLRKGILTTKASNELPNTNGHSDDEIHLRVHRGGGSTSPRYVNSGGFEWESNHVPTQAVHEGQKGTRICNSRDVNGRAQLIISEEVKLKVTDGNSVKWPRKILQPLRIQFGVKKEKQRDKTKSNDIPEMEMLNLGDKNGNSSKHSTLSIRCESPDVSPGHNFKKSPRKCRLLIKEGKSVSLKGHARKFKRETKAAKTLAIIVGAFILCWCPFFTIYLLGAFCQDCVSDLVFAIFFWLGYCNSALNPCIYALFARDFRFAFKRLLSCKRRKGFTQAARADYVTGARSRLTPPVHDNDSVSEY